MVDIGDFTFNRTRNGWEYRPRPTDVQNVGDVTQTDRWAEGWFRNIVSNTSASPNVSGWRADGMSAVEYVDGTSNMDRFVRASVTAPEAVGRIWVSSPNGEYDTKMYSGDERQPEKECVSLDPSDLYGVEEGEDANG